MNHNLGLFYYRTFFTKFYKLSEKVKEDDKTLASELYKINKPFLETELNNEMANYSKQISLVVPNDNPNKFSLTTIYPGLICGVGYEHKIGFKNEFKLGFLFDHTTGLPFLPGSSLKGVIRHYFSMKEYMLKLLSEILEQTSKQELKVSLDPSNLATIDWRKLEKAIFEGDDYLGKKENQSPYKRDIFLDAYISSTEDSRGKILDDDYITSHQNKNPDLSAFTNPNPVRFLKVSSAVTFTFQFRLIDTQVSDEVIFTKEIKLGLFKQILFDQGIGAKTNVGYGQFKESESADVTS